MAIVNTKERAFGPVLIWYVFVFWPHYVEYDGYTILIVVSNLILA